MTIKTAAIFNWIFDILIFIVALPFTALFYLTGFVFKGYMTAKESVGRYLLRHVSNITYDNEEDKEEHISTYTAKETYAIIRKMMKQAEKEDEEYNSIYRRVTKILNDK